MQRVLIVTYYWPPSGGGGVQRWLKFAKYLYRKGWEPIVYHPSNADYPITDQSLGEDIPQGIKTISRPIFEPRKVFSRLQNAFGKRSSGKERLDQIFYVESGQRSFLQNMGIWIRANYFIPDARKYWIKPSIRFLSNYVRENQIKQVITTGPPHSLHLIGLGLKSNFPDIKWIADFRDPWQEIEYFEKLPLTRRNKEKHARLEKKVLTSADDVITVSPSWGRMFQEKGAQNVHIITNGFYQEDFQTHVKKKDEKFRFMHVGTMALDRNPKALWQACSELINTRSISKENLEIAFVGKTDPQIFEELKQTDLAETICDYGYVSHDRAIELMSESDVLLLLLNDGNPKNLMGRIPGKIFEYMAVQKPILLVGATEGDAADIVRQSGGFAVEVDPKKIASVLQKIHTNHKEVTDSESRAIEQFERATLTDQLIAILAKPEI